MKKEVQNQYSSIGVVLFILLGIGLVQVYSSSFMYGLETRHDPYYFLKRFSLFVPLAIFSFIVAQNLSLQKIKNWAIYIWILSAVALIATLVPHLGFRAGGAARWIRLPYEFFLEPSEFLKITLSIFLAKLVSDWYGEHRGTLGTWILKFLIFIFPFILLLKQPDFGSFTICVLVTFTVLFVFGLSWKYVFGIVLTAIPAFYFLVWNVGYRKARVLAFLDPWRDPEQKGFQVIQSMLSMQSGFVWGMGPGEGQAKLLFLPEAHTDFTLAVLGEEFGFVGVMLILSLYGYFVWKGLKITNRSEDIFLRTLALALTMVFALSIIINFGVVMGLLPTKGLALPFLSYGGSSLIMNAFLFGLMTKIEKECQKID